MTCSVGGDGGIVLVEEQRLSTMSSVFSGEALAHDAGCDVIIEAETLPPDPPAHVHSDDISLQLIIHMYLAVLTHQETYQ